VDRPPPHAGLHHLALQVEDLAACERFYTELLGMRVEWRPDADDVYLSSGTDNLALHRASAPFTAPETQHLDHLGFILARPEDVDAWHAFLHQHGVPIKAPPRTHRDGARSFYCRDPDGNVVQFIFHPPLAPSPR
jgi:catechol 2,3-dioxygenase-like lactoylglutathione lyase family enzyme